MEKPSNFLTEIIDADLAEGRVKEIHTRFPPEPIPAHRQRQGHLDQLGHRPGLWRKVQPAL